MTYIVVGAILIGLWRFVISPDIDKSLSVYFRLFMFLIWSVMILTSALTISELAASRFGVIFFVLSIVSTIAFFRMSRV